MSSGQKTMWHLVPKVVSKCSALASKKKTMRWVFGAEETGRRKTSAGILEINQELVIWISCVRWGGGGVVKAGGRFLILRVAFPAELTLKG